MTRERWLDGMQTTRDLHYVDPTTSNDRSGWLSVAIAIFGTASLLTLIIRAWIRLSSHGPWGHDDTTIVAAFVLAMGQVTATGVAIHNGYGKRESMLNASELDLIQKALYCAQLLYVLACFVARWSSGLLIMRLTRYKPHIRAAYGVIGFTIISVIPSFLVLAIRGDLSKPWATMNGSSSMFHRWIGIESAAVVVEIMLFGLSIYLIWGLHMASILRVMILLAFASRLLVIPIIVLRVYYLAPARNPDQTFSTIIAGIITQAAMNYCEIAASMMCIKPFLRAFSSGYVVNSVGGEGSGVASNRDRYRMVVKPSQPESTELTDLSGSHSTAQSATLPANKRPERARTPEISPDSDFRNHRGGFVARVDPQGDDSIENLSATRSSQPIETEDMVIRQTRTWAVQRGLEP